MEWAKSMAVQLHRLQRRLHDHEQLCVDVLAFLRVYGFGPADPWLKIQRPKMGTAVHFPSS
jgi:hypothetical protein